MPRQYFAVVPAAGSSRRMGRPKLLLPLAGQPLIGHVIAAWQRSRISTVLVVVRPDDAELARWARNSGAEVVQPADAPPDMKVSVQLALGHIERTRSPTDSDAFLVAPADMPQLAPAIIDRLIGEHAVGDGQTILAPSLAGKRGHPVLFPWPFASDVHALPGDAGLDFLVHSRPPRLVPCDDLFRPDQRPFADIDTPADYDRWLLPPAPPHTGGA